MSKSSYLQQTCQSCLRSSLICEDSSSCREECARKNFAREGRLVGSAYDRYKLTASTPGGHHTIHGKGSMLNYEPVALSTPENSDSNHVLRTECHKRITLGLECTVVHRDTKCDRRFLMGKEFDLESLQRRCNRCRIANSRCNSDEGVCESCNQNQVFGSDLSSIPEPISSGSMDEEGNVNEPASKKPYTVTSSTPEPGKRAIANSRYCGDTIMHSNRDLAAKCSRCTVGEEDSKSGHQVSYHSQNASPDGRHFMRTCIDCFKPNLDPSSSRTFCEPCQDIRNRVKSSGIRDRERSRSEKSSAGSTQIENGPLESSAFSASAHPSSSSGIFQSCQNHQSHLHCDHALRECTPYGERGEANCRYNQLPLYTEEFKFGPGCLQDNPKPPSDDPTSLYQDCDTPSLLPRLQIATAITTPSAWVPKTPLGVSTSTSVCSNSSTKVTSSSEIPHFLEFVNTRLSDLRLRRNPSSPAPSPNFPPTLSGMPPASLTPCLACLDQQVACAFHPDPQRYGVFNSIVAALTIQDRDPSLAIPCLACFDEETICAHHEAQNAETKTRALQVAQFCGSCRFAEQECDAVETGCGRCEEQELECLYVVGDASPADGLDSGVLPGHEASEVPRPPISCGGCRMAAVACDGLKPDCTACKDQGLDCMYIVGTTPPGPEPVFVVSNTGKYETDEITDDSESQLEGSEFVETTSRQSDATESQPGNSTILELSHDEESAAIDSGNSQEDELESGDWDIVSRNEEYELIEAGEKRGDSDEEDLGRGSRFWL
ncbi:unnamed protein product [Diplocarpon coronariae]